MNQRADRWQRQIRPSIVYGAVVFKAMLGMGMTSVLHADTPTSQVAATVSSPFSPHFATGSDIYATGPSFDASQIPVGAVTLGFMPNYGQALQAYSSTDGVPIRGRFIGPAGGERITGEYQGQTIEFQIQYHRNGGIYLHRVYNGMPDYNFTPTARGSSKDAARELIMIGPWNQIICPVFGGVNFFRKDGSHDATMPVLDVSWEPPHILLQDDGKLVRLSDGALRRTNVDGTPDLTFTPYDASPGRQFQLRDGRIIFVTYTSGQGFELRFLLADGTPDPAATPISWDGHSYAMTQQPDGKILIAGGVSGMVRLNLDGTVDDSFTFTSGRLNPNANAYVSAVLALPDGKIMVGGHFDIANGDNKRRYLVRLHPDGTTDTTFNMGVDGMVICLVQLVDGSTLIAGNFRILNWGRNYGERRGFAKLMPDGSLDELYDPLRSFSPSSNIRAANVQSDGSVLICGSLGSVSYLPGNNTLARFTGEPAISTVTVTPGSGIRWQRGGGAAELMYATFEYRGDGETTWTPLGDGVREPGGWFCAHAGTLPASGLIRARGRTMSSNRAQGVVMESHPFGRSQLTAAEQWLGDRLGDPSGTGPASMTADPDGDGMINLLEYGLSLDPKKPDPSTAQPVWVAADGTHEVTVTPPPGATITYGAEWSTTLQADDWHPAEEVPTNDGRKTFRVPHDAPGTPADKLFFRMRVTE
jgi:uncharacterized delta-60 repeat protein